MKLKLNTIVRGSAMALLLLLSTMAMAQRTLKGTVRDVKSGETLVGASVVVSGTTKGTLTDVSGNYELSAVGADARSLTFSYTGYASRTVNIGASNVIDGELDPGTSLDEVVVIGFGSVKQREVTSAITSISNENFNKGNINDPSALIQGKVPGLLITRAGGDPNGTYEIRLRGVATFGQSSAPLIVVDGFVVPNLQVVDPNDIDRMEILKDGSACAIYGTQGTNGVILISTKRGTLNEPRIEYNVQVANETVARIPQITDADEFKRLGGKDLGGNTDFPTEISQAGLSFVNSLSMSGGTRSSTYRVSANYRDIKGVLLNSGFKNLNFRAFFDQKALNDKLTISLFAVGNRRNGNLSFQEAWRYAFITNPTAPVFNAANTENGGYFEATGFEQFNPVALLKQNQNLGQDIRFQFGARGELQIFKGLTWSNQFSQQQYNANRQEYYSKFSQFRGKNAGGLAIQSNLTNRLDQFISMLNYSTALNSTLELGLTAGYDYQENKTSSYRASAGNFPTDGFDYNNFGASKDIPGGLANINSNAELSKLVAFFGRASLNVNDYLFLAASLRREGSTKFGEGNKWGLFPGVSAGLDLNHFIKSEKLSTLKLRVGYGRTGNLPLNSYRSQALYTSGDLYPMNGANNSSWIPQQNPNQDLKWETKDEYNVGIDFAALNFRLQGALDVYSRSTKDLLYEFSVPSPNNVVEKTLINIGELQNSGIELVLGYDIFQGEKFKWNSGVNFATYNTKLARLSDESRAITFAAFTTANVGAPGLNGSDMFYVEEGEALGNIYGPKWFGVKENGKPDLDTTNTILGNGLPKFSLGWNNTFNFGKVDLNFLLRGVFGHDLINQYRQFYENTDANQSYNMVKTKYWEDGLEQALWSSHYVENGDFLALDNITLGYTLPMGANSPFNSVRAYVNGNRLFYLTNYTGVDPEVRFNDINDSDNGGRIDTGVGNPFAPGVDRRSTYVRTRSVAFGLNFVF